MKKNLLKHLLITNVIALGLITNCFAKETKTTINLSKANEMKTVNVKAKNTTWKGHFSIEVADTNPDDESDNRFVVIPNSEFSNGNIEIDLAGEVATNAGPDARGFVGIAFHMLKDFSKFELLYLRPTNGRADDQIRRNHSVQYVSSPEFPWFKLRKEFPEQYESYADMTPATWIHTRIEVEGTKARLYVNNAKQPCLIVNDLKLGASSGQIGLWIGPGTIAHFSNLRINKTSK